MPFERNASDRLVDREGRIAISHAGVVDPLVFEADIDAAPEGWLRYYAELWLAALPGRLRLS